MAERADHAHAEHNEAPPETPLALASLALVERLSRGPQGDRWTARAADGRVLDAWCLGRTDAAPHRRWTDAAPGLARVRHPNVVAVLAAGEREGELWVVSEPDAGAPLHRLLTVATLTPGQAALIIVGILGGLGGLHQAGLTHDRLDDRTVYIGDRGQVRLGGWGLELDGADTETRRLGDRRAAVNLFGRLGRSVRWSGRQADTATALRHTLEACRGEAGAEAPTPEQAGEAAAAVLEGPAGERAAVELAALVGLLERDAPPPRPVPEAAPPSRLRPGPPPAIWMPAPHRGRWVAAGLAVLVLVGVAGVLTRAALSARPRSPAVQSHAGRPTSTPAVTRPRSPSPSPPAAAPRAVPVLAPATAGPITAIEIQTLAGSCQPDAACPVQVTVRLQPQQAAQEVRWSFRVIDRCTGAITTLPGVSVTALAGWAYVYGTSWPALPGAHPLALVAISETPTVAASPAVLAGGSGPC